MKLIALSLATVAYLLSPNAHAATALCGGTSFPVIATLGPTPHIAIDVDGRRGQFLIDYGATQGTLWTQAPSASTGTRHVTVGLPGVASADFLLRHDADAHADAPAGIVGTDVLSLVTMQREERELWISASACDADALRAAGFRPIDQAGFFSTDRVFTDVSKPNVPVLYVQFGSTRTWAQIDSGYDDLAGSNSVDINQALFDLLGGEEALVADGDTIVVTCEGVEIRRAYRLKKDKLAVTDEHGVMLRTLDTHRLMLKRKDRCGGIASMAEPAAQVGASFLQALGTMIFDPRAHRVWLRANISALAP